MADALVVIRETQATTSDPTTVSPVTVKGAPNPGGAFYTFTFNNGASAIYTPGSYPHAVRDGTDPGQLSVYDRAMQFAIDHVVVQPSASDAEGQQAFANMAAGLTEYWLGINAKSGSNDTVSQPNLPNGTVIDPITVTPARAEFIKGTWYIDNTAGQEGGPGNNVYDSNTGTWKVYIKAKAINDYAALPGGIEYLIGHEFGHDSSGGLAANDYFYNQYLNDEYIHGVTWGPNSTNFQNNEAYANTVSAHMAAWLGFTVMADPKWGYDLFHH